MFYKLAKYFKTLLRHYFSVMVVICQCNINIFIALILCKEGKLLITVRMIFMSCKTSKLGCVM